MWRFEEKYEQDRQYYVFTRSWNIVSEYRIKFIQGCL